MANEKVILMLQHAPLESTTLIKKSSKSCKSWFKRVLQGKMTNLRLDYFFDSVETLLHIFFICAVAHEANPPDFATEGT